MECIESPTFKIIEKRHAVITEDYDCGEFIIPAGFHFDGATMPWWTWSLMRLDPFERITGAAAPHDLLYVNLGRVRAKDGSWLYYSEPEADEMFYRRAITCDLNWLQARLVRRAVIWFGDYDFKHKSNCYKWNVEWLERYNNNGCVLY